MHYIKAGNAKEKITDSRLNGNFSNPWPGKKEDPQRMVELVHSPYVPINFTKRKLLLDTAPTPASHLTNMPLVTHKRTWMALVTISKNHGGNSDYVYSSNNAQVTRQRL